MGKPRGSGTGIEAPDLPERRLVMGRAASFPVICPVNNRPRGAQHADWVREAGKVSCDAFPVRTSIAHKRSRGVPACSVRAGREASLVLLLVHRGLAGGARDAPSAPAQRRSCAWRPGSAGRKVGAPTTGRFARALASREPERGAECEAAVRTRQVTSVPGRGVGAGYSGRRGGRAYRSGRCARNWRPPWRSRH